jgi:hypothetical protein
MMIIHGSAKTHTQPRACAGRRPVARHVLMLQVITNIYFQRAGFWRILRGEM